MSDTPNYRLRLSEVIRDGEVDPRKAAEKVRTELDADEIDDLVTAALVGLARELMRSIRVPSAVVERPVAAKSKYAAMRDLTSTPAAWPVCPTGRADGWKKLGDCTADDLDLIAAKYEQSAAKFSTLAAQYRDLATALRKSKAKTVAGLPASALRGLVSA